MVKITDLLGAFVEVQFQAAEWEQEFQAIFFGPLALAQQVQAFLAADDETRESLRLELPPHEMAQMRDHAGRLASVVNPPLRVRGQSDTGVPPYVP